VTTADTVKVSSLSLNWASSLAFVVLRTRAGYESSVGRARDRAGHSACFRCEASHNVRPGSDQSKWLAHNWLLEKMLQKRGYSSFFGVK
jgi:hypothetical protein